MLARQVFRPSTRFAAGISEAALLIALQAIAAPAIAQASPPVPDQPPAARADIPASATAEEQAAPAESAQPVEKTVDIVVTASRINRAGFQAPTPTTVIGSAEIQKTGATNVADLLNTQVPSFANSRTPQTAGTSTANAGANFLNLRGLGPTRTLVLVDGRRYVPTTVTAQLDINVVPSALIDRIDVVTGGASAAWGSDAVAGVVNLIFKKNVEGIQGDGQVGESTYGDERQYRVSVVAGHAFLGGRLHETLAGEYADNKGVLREDSRPLGRQGWALIANPDFTPTNGQPSRIIASNVRLSNETNGGLINSGPLKGTVFLPNGQTGTLTYGTLVGSSFMVGGSGDTLEPNQDIEPPVQRWSIYNRLSYDISPNTSIFFEASHASSHVVSTTVPPNDSNLVINADNAFLPDNVRALMAQNGLQSFRMGRIGQDLGLMIVDIHNKTNRFAGGLEGSFGTSWTWNVYGEAGRTNYLQQIHNTQVATFYRQAIDAVVDPADGTIVCRSTLTDPEDGCVPLNLFGEGSPSLAAKDYVMREQWARTIIREKVASASIQGEPFSTWAGPVSIATGADYRKESAVTTSDALAQAAAYRLGNVQPFQGSFDVVEGFVETVVPLARDLPFARSLDFNGAVRETRYSTSGFVTTWKAGLTYQPVSDLRFRFTRSRDIRAPNLSELYTARQQTVSNIIDPRDNSQKQIFVLRAGNPNLNPEVADTLAYGVVLQPHWLPGLQASVDAYKIDIAGAIATLTPQETIDRCFDGETAICDLVVQDSSGTITTVNAVNINLQRLSTSGIDLEASYNLPLSRISSNLPGRLSLRFLGNYVKKLETSTGVTSTDVAGQTGGDGAPHWRLNWNATYDVGRFGAYVSGRYIGPGKYDITMTDAELLGNQLPSRVYWDISASYILRQRKDQRLQVFGVVRNLFNREAPIAPGGSTQGLPTNTALFDYVGRTFAAGIRFKY